MNTKHYRKDASFLTGALLIVTQNIYIFKMAWKSALPDLYHQHNYGSSPCVA
ncbi:hypothetical protein ACE6H2_016709 [Prunus campanulata]